MSLPSQASITAFEDSWHWGGQAEREFDEVIKGNNTELAKPRVQLLTVAGSQARSAPSIPITTRR